MLARTEGVILDPVYTGKAFFGMTQELSRDPNRFGDRIVFMHTGGIFGLFSKANEFHRLWHLSQKERVSWKKNKNKKIKNNQSSNQKRKTNF